MAPSVSSRGRATRTRLSHIRALPPLSRRRLQNRHAVHTAGLMAASLLINTARFPLNVLLRFVIRQSLRHTAATKPGVALIMAR